MDFKGYVDKGWIKPTKPMTLPDGTPVTFTRAKTETRRGERPGRIVGWRSRSVRDLATEQGTKALRSLAQLAGDWPSSNSIDEFLKSVCRGRA